MTKTLVVTGVALSLAVLGGCSRGEQKRVDQQAQGLGAIVEQAAKNGALEARVTMALATRKALKGTHIHVRADGSVVTLKGDVNTRQQAAAAVQVAKGTEGVTAVSDQLALRVPVAGSEGGRPSHAGPLSPTRPSSPPPR